ncbi:hypothetical protein C8Q79DRAFT_900551 [Trametes meyenii]|nr:hypothetical protein C8Q79DRAFT_900551 [Trametes meyenii]
MLLFYGAQVLAITLLYIVRPTSGVTTLVDNAASSIQYEGPWQMVASTGEDDLDGTLAGSNENAGIAKFLFNGTSVTVYGALRPVGVWDMYSLYYLDNNPAIGYRPDPNVNSEEHRVVFYTSGPLSNGPHSLEIENMGTQLWFDYVAVEAPDSDTTSVSVSNVTPTGTLLQSTSTASRSSSTSLPAQNKPLPTDMPVIAHTHQEKSLSLISANYY